MGLVHTMQLMWRFFGNEGSIYRPAETEAQGLINLLMSIDAKTGGSFGIAASHHGVSHGTTTVAQVSEPTDSVAATAAPAVPSPVGEAQPWHWVPYLILSRLLKELWVQTPCAQAPEDRATVDAVERWREGTMEGLRTTVFWCPQRKCCRFQPGRGQEKPFKRFGSLFPSDIFWYLTVKICKALCRITWDHQTQLAMLTVLTALIMWTTIQLDHNWTTSFQRAEAKICGRCWPPCTWWRPTQHGLRGLGDVRVRVTSLVRCVSMSFNILRFLEVCGA